MDALTSTLGQEVIASDSDGLDLLESTHHEDEQTVAVNFERADDLQKNITAFTLEDRANKDATQLLLASIGEHRKALAHALESRQRALRDLSAFLDFSRDCREMRSFMAVASETAQRTEYQDLTLAQQAAVVQDKLTKDMKSMSAILDSVYTKENHLTAADNLNSVQIAALTETLRSEWAALTAEADQRGKRIAEAVAYIEWHDQVERIRLSLQQKHAVVEVTETPPSRLRCLCSASPPLSCRITTPCSCANNCTAHLLSIGRQSGGEPRRVRLSGALLFSLLRHCGGRRCARSS
jgi:hypothetical protein